MRDKQRRENQSEDTFRYTTAVADVNPAYLPQNKQQNDSPSDYHEIDFRIESTAGEREVVEHSGATAVNGFEASSKQTVAVTQAEVGVVNQQQVIRDVKVSDDSHRVSTASEDHSQSSSVEHQTSPGLDKQNDDQHNSEDAEFDFFSSKRNAMQDKKSGDIILYKVIATNEFTAEDEEEELNFEAGHVINVIQPEEEEFLDEGWQMGVNTATGKRGLFPENFTKRL